MVAAYLADGRVFQVQRGQRFLTLVCEDPGWRDAVYPGDKLRVFATRTIALGVVRCADCGASYLAETGYLPPPCKRCEAST